MSRLKGKQIRKYKRSVNQYRKRINKLKKEGKLRPVNSRPKRKKNVKFNVFDYIDKQVEKAGKELAKLIS